MALNVQNQLHGAVTGVNGAKGNGIASIEKTGTSGLVDTYTITYTDGNTETFEIKNGADGATGATGNGISKIQLNDNYTLTFTYTNGSKYTTTSIRGLQGEKGDKPTKGVDYFTNDEIQEFKDEIVSGANSDFNDNVTQKMNAFNSNASSKTDIFNTNASSKTNAFNSNVTGKTNTFNSNATSQTQLFNNNATSKTNDFNTNYSDKRTAYDQNASSKVQAFNSNATTKTSDYNTNAQTKLEAYNTNAQTKTEDYNSNAEEKLEEYNDNASDLMQSVEELEAKHDAEVAELQAEIDDLQEELDMTADLIPTDTPEPSSNITINDSARVRFKKFVLGGKSEQETRSGKNKFDYRDATIVANKYINYNTGNIAGTNDTMYATESYEEIEPSTVYSLTGSSNLRVAFYDENNIFISGKNNSFIGFTTPENAKYFRVSALDLSVVMLLKGNTEDTGYEEYGVMPSPEFPSEIQNVTGDVNIFNEEQLSNSSLYQSSTNYFAYVEMPSNFKSKFYASMFLKGLEQNLVAGFSDGNNNVSTRILDNAQLKNDVIYDFTNAEHVYFVIGNTNRINIERDIPLIFDNYNIKVSKEKITAYTPYNCGNVEVKVENKNLCNSVVVGSYYPDTGTISDNNKYRTIVANKLPPGTYTASTNLQNCYILRIWKDNQSNTISQARNSYTFTTSTTDKVLISIRNTTSTEITEDVWGQIEEGSTATDYIAHEEQTATFPLEEGQVLHLSDTIEDKIVQRRETVVFDGTEDWALINAEVGQFKLAINDMTKNPILCNYFGYKLTYSVSGKPYLRPADGAIFAEIGTEMLEEITVNAWKAWLAEKYANGTPLTLEYELAEPIEIPFTQAQATAKAQIAKLYSYKGITHITSEAVVDVTYRKDYTTITDARLDELEARIALLE